MPLRAFMLSLVCLLFAGRAYAGSVTVAWDPNTEHDIAGYVVMYGSQPGRYTGSVDVGNRTQHTLVLPDGTYYIAVQAYDTKGVRSDASAEVTANVVSRGADFNQDGRLDILLRNETDGSVATWLMSGTSLVDGRALNPGRVPDLQWQIAGSGDFNGDGRADVLWRHAGTGGLAVWLMEGTTAAQIVWLSPARVPDLEWSVRAVSDLNGDGKPDLVWAHKNGGLAAWIMDGTRQARVEWLSVSRMPDPKWQIVAGGDLDADGKADLVWQHDDGWLAAWLMDGSTRREVRWLSPNRLNTPEWRVRALTDLNGDGSLDLLLEHHTLRELAAWLLDGETLIDGVMLDPSSLGTDGWRLAGPR